MRGATDGDADGIWRVLEPIIRAGETYALPRDLGREDALKFWCAPEHEVFVADTAGEIAGTYFLCANQRGGGSHVANCGYATAVASQGKGVGGMLCAHSLERAKEGGFRAMQFNFVVSTNERAVRLWQRFGFSVVGRLEGAFAHPTAGFVDALVMYRSIGA